MPFFKDYKSDTIELTEERWSHVVSQHPEIEVLKDKIEVTLADPDYVKRSLRDSEVELYYRFFEDVFEGKYFLVVVKGGDKRKFLLTCYVTDAIKKGETLWQRET